MILRDGDIAGAQQQLENAGQVVDLRLGHGHIAPIVRPGVIDDVEQQGDFGFEMRLVHADIAQGDFAAAHGAGQQLVQHLGRRVGTIAIGDQVFRFAVILRGDAVFIVGQVMAHHHIGRGVEAFDQQAGLVP